MVVLTFPRWVVASGVVLAVTLVLASDADEPCESEGVLRVDATCAVRLPTALGGEEGLGEGGEMLLVSGSAETRPDAGSWTPSCLLPRLGCAVESWPHWTVHCLPKRQTSRTQTFWSLR